MAADPFNADPDRSIEEMLAAIKSGAEVGSQRGSGTPNLAIPAFAALLVRLARTAEATATKIVRLTWGLIGLTIALLALTGALLVEDAYKASERNTLEQNSQQQKP